MLQNLSAVCRVIAMENLFQIIKILCFHGATVFIEKPKPEIQKIVIEPVFYIFSGRFRKNRTYFGYQSVFFAKLFDQHILPKELFPYRGYKISSASNVFFAASLVKT